MTWPLKQIVADRGRNVDFDADVGVRQLGELLNHALVDRLCRDSQHRCQLCVALFKRRVCRSGDLRARAALAAWGAGPSCHRLPPRCRRLASGSGKLPGVELHHRGRPILNQRLAVAVKNGSARRRDSDRSHAVVGGLADGLIAGQNLQEPQLEEDD